MAARANRGIDETPSRAGAQEVNDLAEKNRRVHAVARKRGRGEFVRCAAACRVGGSLGQDKSRSEQIAAATLDSRALTW
jgi:hypothetical protein